MSARALFVFALACGYLSAQPPAGPPPMFPPWYGEALRGTLQLESPDVARLEKQLAADPNDIKARLRLMAYHQRGDRAAIPADRARRFAHTLWLIEHHPSTEVLHSPVSHFAPSDVNAADLRRASALWERALAQASAPNKAAVAWNAATFFEGLDPARHLQYLEMTAAADPNHPFALRPLAHLYALAILERGPLAARAQAGLDASNNVWVLGNAAYMFQSRYNQSLQSKAPNPRASELAERYFLRAKAVNPELDRKTILPEIDIRAVERVRQANVESQRELERRAATGRARLRRLPLTAFPDLPPTVAAVLRNRNCRIPQPELSGKPRNVIRGEFFAKGEPGWAVFCSANQRSSLLVFRSDDDANPMNVASVDERSTMQLRPGDRAVFPREIARVDRDYIVSHYRAYGGPKPPPIDHDGIDDSFLESASVVWYFHNSKWLRLQGAD